MSERRNHEAAKLLDAFDRDVLLGSRVGQAGDLYRHLLSKTGYRGLVMCRSELLLREAGLSPADLRQQRRANILNVIAEELRRRAEELELQVVEISPRAIRERVVGNPHATKIQVAEKLANDRFPQLRGFIPKRPMRAALAMRPKDKYWLHMFDALAIATTAHLRN